MQLLIKLFPEISIKSRSVRMHLIRTLNANIQLLLKRAEIACEVKFSWDCLMVNLLPEAADKAQRAIDILSRTPGVETVLTIEAFQVSELDAIADLVGQFYSEQIAGKSFCVRAKRGGKHAFTSHEVEIRCGSALLAKSTNARVKLKNPEVEINLEVRNDQTFLVSQITKGLGGYPLGTQKEVLSLISGGFDSCVASYLTMKRGVKTHYCFFNLGGTAHEVGVKQVAHFLWQRYGASHRVQFISVPFQAVVEEILRSVIPSLMGVMLKRLMLRAASRIAEEKRIPALVTGESIAQVSSQTLTNLSVIDRVTDMLVLRPLITMNKQEIIDLSRHIEVESYAQNMPEYCGVISKRPSAGTSLEKILKQEQGFNFEVLEEAIANTQYLAIDSLMDSQLSAVDVEMVQTPAVNDRVIDIRHPDEIDKAPLHLTNNEVLAIPFYELRGKFADLDQQHHYLLYCGRGVMSQIHAQELTAEGYANVRVYANPS